MHALLSFAVVAGLLTLVPGMDTALVLRAAVSEGRRYAFASAVGIGSGTLVWDVAAAAGVSVLLTTPELAYSVRRATWPQPAPSTTAGAGTARKRLCACENRWGRTCSAQVAVEQVQ
ncbi:LysE family translocator [Nocardia sp. NPDC059229]